MDEERDERRESKLARIHTCLVDAGRELQELYETGQSSPELVQATEEVKNALLHLKADGHAGRWTE